MSETADKVAAALEAYNVAEAAREAARREYLAADVGLISAKARADRAREAMQKAAAEWDHAHAALEAARAAYRAEKGRE